ncbi:aldehyde dehydrogenase [Sphingomonas sp.]|uniref:aldehyde dehydrogenase n=1 Tax=Sphingomonas sp. TaxID=28214 RepID=UPI003B00449F
MDRIIAGLPGDYMSPCIFEGTVMTTIADEPISIAHPDKLFVDGAWIDTASSRRLDLVNPATEGVFMSVVAADVEDVHRAVAAARRAFDKGPWPRMSPQERATTLDALAAALTERTHELAHCWTRQMGAPFAMAQQGTTAGIGFIGMNTGLIDQVQWTKEMPTVFPGSKGMLVAEPVGVVAAIAPWNGPLFLMLVKIAPALLAGCTVILKPAPETPLEAYILAECAEAVGFPAGVINLLPAETDVANELVLHPDVDKVSFTGSTAAGRKIASEVGARIGRVTLELGGKSAAIVLDDYDMATAAQNLAYTIANLTGQFCTNLTRILVPRARKDEFVSAMAAAMRGLKVGDPYDPDTYLGPTAGKRHLDKVMSYIEKGKSEGVLAVGGGRPEGLDRGFYVEPTLFVDVDNSAVISREEIFGPVACVITYETLDEAIEIANDTIYGLAGSVFTNDAEAAYRVARGVRTGTIAQNGLKFDFSIGFGGFKQSGLGREGGVRGVEHYLEYKTVILDDKEAA